YVALTRARDMLYLGTVLTDKGEARPGHGSLGKVLPASFMPLLEQAARADEVSWTVGARTYPFRVCPPPGDAPLVLDRPKQVAPAAGDFAPLAVDPAIATTAVTAAGGPPAAGEHAAGRRDQVPLEDRLLGTLVHRMLQRMPAGDD